MDQLEEIKSKIDIVDLISEYLPLKKAGRNFKALCPFHTEKIPSFIVSPERQIWHCFGACNEGGDIFKFLMKWENMEFPEALKVLAKRAGVTLKRFEPTETSRLKEKLYEINHLASEFFHWVLLKTKIGKRALDYALKRGITPDSIETFTLGYAPNSWESLQKFLLKHGYEFEDMEKAGLVIKRESRPGYYDRFRGRLMFALRNHRGRVAGFSGRVLDPQTSEAKYINTPETPIYTKRDLLYGLEVTKKAIKNQGLAVVVEGELDLISSYQVGVKNVVAIKGSALTENQARLLKRYTENIALALDRDLAGDQAVRRGIETADAAGLAVKVVVLKGGKDPDECIQKNPNLWRESVEKTVPVYDFLIDSAVSRFNPSTADGKREIGREVLPSLAAISDGIVRAHYLQRLAGLLGVDEEILVAEMGKLRKSKARAKLEPGDELGRPTRSRQEVLEEYLLALILQGLNLAPKLPTVKKSDFSTPALRRIYEELLGFVRKKQSFSASEFVRKLPAELIEILDRLYLRDLGRIGQSQEKLKKEIVKTRGEVRRLILRKELEKLSGRIKEAEEVEDEGQLEMLRRKFGKIALKLEKLTAEEG